MAGITTLEEANRFLRWPRGQDLVLIFSVQTERTVDNDNTVAIVERVWQIERTRWRGTLAGCRVTICEHSGTCT